MSKWAVLDAGWRRTELSDGSAIHRIFCAECRFVYWVDSVVDLAGSHHDRRKIGCAYVEKSAHTHTRARAHTHIHTHTNRRKGVGLPHAACFKDSTNQQRRKMQDRITTDQKKRQDRAKSRRHNGFSFDPVVFPALLCAMSVIFRSCYSMDSASMEEADKWQNVKMCNQSINQSV